ncbi:MAG: 6-phosphogluconolactonase [Candidatus Hydrogenedentes bacterium]|nr:6-phosphogluconolactonase [Candidatus Hydrogenedentota bacterium]
MSTAIQVTHYESEKSLQAAVVELLKRELSQPAAAPQAVLLSGGRTPLPIFAEIAAHPFPVAATACMAYSDDRHVLMDSPESNYGASLAMLRALHLPDAQIIRVQTEFPLGESAQRYDADLRRFAEAGGQFALALLGLGADGHTCSLFTEADLERSSGHWAIPVERPAPPHRVSVTPGLLVQVRRIIFLVSGVEKEQVVQRLLHQPERVVAGRAVADCPKVELWRA